MRRTRTPLSILFRRKYQLELPLSDAAGTVEIVGRQIVLPLPSAES